MKSLDILIQIKNKIMKVFWATKLRGFLKHLSEGLNDVEFSESSQYYETNK